MGNSNKPTQAMIDLWNDEIAHWGAHMEEATILQNIYFGLGNDGQVKLMEKYFHEADANGDGKLY